MGSAQTKDRTLKNILEDFLKVDGVRSCIVVGRDGFIIESQSSGNIDTEGLGVMVATAIGTTEVLGQESDIGSLNQYMAEYKSGNIFIASVGDEILCVQTDNTVVLGSVRHAIRKHMKELETVL